MDRCPHRSSRHLRIRFILAAKGSGLRMAPVIWVPVSEDEWVPLHASVSAPSRHSPLRTKYTRVPDLLSQSVRYADYAAMQHPLE